MDLATDIQSMIALSQPFAGGLPTAVNLPSGRMVQAAVGVASVDDAMIREDVVSGQTRKLTMVTSQIQGLKTQQNVTWNGRLWGVIATSLEANGAATAAFVGDAF
jgi:hypothetical protein